MKRRYHKTVKEIGAKEPHVNALFKHLDASGMTVREAAELSGVEAQVLSNWRRGASSPRLDLFVAVCNSVGLIISIRTGSNKRVNSDQLELAL